MNIFQEILDTRSKLIIDYISENALPQATSDAERTALTAIIATNKLDEAWALAHEQLGQHEDAAKLRAFMASRPARASLGLF